MNFTHILKDQIELFLAEDELVKNAGYLFSLPEDTVTCHLKIKDDLTLAGLPFFFEVFNYLAKDPIHYNEFLEFESREFKKEENFQINFSLPFNVALSGERLALNLLQRGSSIATHTKRFVEAASGISILDTRKTTPGLRSLEKYAVKMGGGMNHRFSQLDAFMIKDNHKAVFGGIENAIDFFQSQKAFYCPLIVEIHNLEELSLAYEKGVKHFLLDNFSPGEISEAVSFKKQGMTYEVSGGINLSNIRSYCMEGVDAFSSGAIIYNAPMVDLSLKMSK